MTESTTESRLLDSAGADHPAIQQYLLRIRRRCKRATILTITIADNGPGIQNHYRAAHKSERTTADGLLLQNVLQKQVSSVDSSVHGQGIPNALDALYRLNGLVSVRSNKSWLVSSRADRSEARRMGVFSNADLSNKLTDARGVVYNILLPIQQTFN